MTNLNQVLQVVQTLIQALTDKDLKSALRGLGELCNLVADFLGTNAHLPMSASPADDECLKQLQACIPRIKAACAPQGDLTSGPLLNIVIGTLVTKIIEAIMARRNQTP